MHGYTVLRICSVCVCGGGEGLKQCGAYLYMYVK